MSRRMPRHMLFFLALGLALLLCMPFVFSQAEEAKNLTIYVFHSPTCSHCKKELAFLETIKPKYPELTVKEFDVNAKENAELLSKIAKAYGTEPLGVPMTFIGKEYVSGYDLDTDETGELIEQKIKGCLENGCIDPSEMTGQEENNSTGGTIKIPVIGEIDVSKISLPLFTVIIAGLDSFNPCAIWVLCFLLTLLINAQSRKKMILVGSIFVFASGFVYFLFMTAWLNFFLFVGFTSVLRIIIAAVAIIAGLINVKDFFFFKKGVSLTIPESAKPKLFKRMRGLVHETAIPGVIIGTAVLAFTANTFELLCTAGFPAIYTRILTLKALPAFTYYLYLVLYNLIYIIPLAIIVTIFVFTMGAHRFTEKEGRWLKLIGGALMLVLGLLLLVRPEMLAFG